MGRRSSVLEDLMELGARLPRRVALGFAFVSFLVFHLVSIHFSIPVSAQSIADLGTVAQQFLGGIASILQFVVPAAFVGGAVVSWVKGARARESFDRVATDGVSAVSALSWREFEALIGEGFRRQGYTVTGNDGRRGPDGGVDLALVKRTERFLVQCKHWRRSSVGVTVIREFYGVMTARAVAGGVCRHVGFVHAGCLGIRRPVRHRVDRWSAVGRVDLASEGTGAGKSHSSGRGACRTRDHFGRNVEACVSAVRRRDGDQDCGSRILRRSTFLGMHAYPRCRGTLPA
jgi:HJR/Mrr/RecB family endonuclease